MKTNIAISILIGVLLGTMLFPMIMIPVMGAMVVFAAIYLMVHDVIMPYFQHRNHNQEHTHHH